MALIRFSAMPDDNPTDPKLADYDRFLLARRELEGPADARREKAGSFPFRPLISILMQVDTTRESRLGASLESVLGQVYDNWELCIVYCGSIGRATAETLKHCAGADHRIKVKAVVKDSGAGGSTNEAAAMASGDFTGLLDCGDELDADALYEVAHLLNRKPGTDFVYSDEDRIGEAGVLYDPCFKPDWSPDLLRSCNYIGRFAVIKRCLLYEAGGFRPDYGGAMDYDMVLRTTERALHIEHVPKVLYHRRSLKASHATAGTGDLESAKKALHDHLERTGLEGDVSDGCLPGSFRVRYRKRGTPAVSIIIPTRDQGGALGACINSITGKSTYYNYEILVVDNGSSREDTFRCFRELEKCGRVRVIRYDRPFNYSALNNYAAARSRGEQLLFLNDDTEVISAGWIEALLEFSQRKDVGAAGALLYFPDGSIQHAGVILGMGGVAGHAFRHMPGKEAGYSGRAKLVQNLSAVTAACLMMRRGVFEETGGFDEGFSHAYNDIDLCMRIRERGYLVVYTPYAELYHHESLSRGQEDSPARLVRFCKEVRLFCEKWRGLLVKGDPYYNDNLTLLRNDFSIKGIYELFCKDLPVNLLVHPAHEEAEKWWLAAQEAWKQVGEAGSWAAVLESRLSEAGAEAGRLRLEAAELSRRVEEAGSRLSEAEQKLLESEKNIAAILNSRAYRLGAALARPLRKLRDRK